MADARTAMTEESIREALSAPYSRAWCRHCDADMSDPGHALTCPVDPSRELWDRIHWLDGVRNKIDMALRATLRGRDWTFINGYGCSLLYGDEVDIMLARYPQLAGSEVFIRERLGIGVDRA